MSFNFFENGINSGFTQTPNDMFREQQQAAIEQEWEYTSARYKIKEQSDFGSSKYNDIEVWIDNGLGLTSRGMANGADFKKLLFCDIYHPVKRGLYYKFDGNTWLTYFTDNYSSIGMNIGIRRCNNVMRIIDPENGSVFSVPCVIDYDMTSPSAQVNSSIITPNNHAVVMVQGNQDTIRLFKLNTRYIFGGRPFKLLAYQNALVDEAVSEYSTLLYLELYLDEIHANDNIEQQLADNGTYNYEVQIESNDMKLVTGSKGNLAASVTLNKKEVTKKVGWKSENIAVVQVNNNGEYEITGKNGDTCKIFCYLQGNAEVQDEITITVVEDSIITPTIIVNPAFHKIRQFETIAFNISVFYNGKEFDPSSSKISLDKNSDVYMNEYLSIVKNKNNYHITANKIANEQQHLYIEMFNDTPSFNKKIDYTIEVKSMLG